MRRRRRGGDAGHPALRRLRLALLAGLALAALPGAARGAGSIVAQPIPVGAPDGAIVALSNGRTFSRWAYPNSETVVRASPAQSARVTGRLRLLTSDDQAALYIELAATQDPTGESWIRVELPGRPNGQTGWVPAGALGPARTVNGYLLVDERRLKATLYRDGHVIFAAPVGVGKPGTITPAGRFYVMEKLVTLHAPLYGPYAIGTSAYAPTLSEWPGGGVVGIHGTNEPELIPGRPSHGCVRMRNGDITRLWHTIELGTPIVITGG
jgi:hypothetical protein